MPAAPMAVAQADRLIVYITHTVVAFPLFLNTCREREGAVDEFGFFQDCHGSS